MVQNEKRIKGLLTSALKKDRPKASLLLADVYSVRNRLGLSSDPAGDISLYVKYLRESAVLGCQEAQYFLGQYLENTQNFSEAVAWYKRVQQNHPASQAILGLMYLDDCGVEYGRHNREKAMYHFNSAFEAGNSAAAYALGLEYEKGSNVTQDYGRAVEFYLHVDPKNSCYSVVKDRIAYLENIMSESATSSTPSMEGATASTTSPVATPRALSVQATSLQQESGKISPSATAAVIGAKAMVLRRERVTEGG